MEPAVRAVNAALTAAFDLMLRPFAGIDPVWGVVFVSLVSGVVFLLIYGKVSNQRALRRVKDEITGSILEAFLFRHDLGVSLRAQGRLFVKAGKYFALAVPPIIVLMIPCLLILAQLNLRYSARPLEPGERAIVRVALDDRSLVYRASLDVPEGLAVTPPVRMPEANEVAWRVEATRPGVFPVSVRIGRANEHFDTTIAAERAPFTAEQFRSWWWSALYPSRDGGLPPSVRELTVSYPGEELELFGVGTNWLVLFLVLSILSGIAASRVFKVEI